jgi:hypothetical protein
MAKKAKRAKAKRAKVKRAKVAKSGKAKAASGKVKASKVAERAMPGWKAVAPSGPVRSYGAAIASDSATPSKATVDAVMPSTEELHKKYFGAASADAAVVAKRSPAKMLGDNVSVVEMRSGDLRKSVGVNAQTKKVEWSQG